MSGPSLIRAAANDPASGKSLRFGRLLITDPYCCRLKMPGWTHIRDRVRNGETVGVQAATAMTAPGYPFVKRSPHGSSDPAAVGRSGTRPSTRGEGSYKKVGINPVH